MHQLARSLLVTAALLALPSARAQSVTNWAAFNDYVPSAITHSNANTYNLRGIAGTPPEPVAGFLKDFITGATTPAYIIAEATGSPDFFGSISYPNAGTPAYNLFNGIVDLGNVNSAIGIRASANTTVTLTFSNLNPSQRYIFRGTVVRGNNYVRRWTLASLRGAASFTNAHTTGVYTSGNFPSGTMTNGQAAYNSGENRSDGALVGWDNIDPGPDGIFTVKCEQYTDNPLPNGQTPDLGNYGYSFAGIYLAEVGAPTPVSITANPPDPVVLEQNRPLNLSGNAQGAPAPAYQWYKDNAPISGANSRNYSVALAQPGDSGNYYLVASNLLNQATSTVAHVTVYPDTNGPVLLSVKADESFQILRLTWDEPVEQGAAIELSNYVISDPGGNPVSVNAIDYNGSSVVLHVPTLLTDTNYSIEIDFQTDNLSHPTAPVGSPTVDANGIVTNFHTFVIAQGFTRFQAYLNLPSGQSIPQFVAMPIYPNGASFGFITNTLYWPQTAPNVEQYAMRFSGLFIAPEDGLYKFNPAHDDDAQLLMYSGLHTNGTAFPPFTEVCCNDLVAGNTLDVTLTAGQTYYYELIVREFGGGDYAGLSVVLPSGPTNSPISAQYLAAAIDPDTVPNFGIAQQPQNQTIDANHTATFSVTVTNTGGSANYQWQRNSGSGFTNVAGANAASYTTPYQPLANSGDQYRVVVSAPGRSRTSSAATLTVTNDTTAPRVLSVHGNRDLNQITVFFDEAMDAGSAGEASNYQLTDASSNPLALSSPVVGADLKSVTLTTDPQSIGGFYTLHVDGVSDVAGNPINPTNVTFRAWIVSRGFVLFEVYNTGGGNAVSDLTSNPLYPNSPREVYYLRTFDSRGAYPDDSHEGYGARISGYFLPPATTNYIFYLRSDDASELWVNTNAVNSTASAGRTKLQEETACCNAFSLHPTTNPPPSLIGGQAYYLDILFKEGTGGDFGQVAVKMAGDPTNPDTLSGIAGTFLATLADPVGSSVNITQQPVSTNIQPGQAASFAVRASGTISSGVAPLAYQWQKKVGGVFVDIPNASSSNYTTGTLTNTDNGSQYRALVFIPGASATSAVATVTVGTPQPTLRYSSSGGSITLSWDDPGLYLQCATSLAPPIQWQDVTFGGQTSYTVTPANEFNVTLNSAQENNPLDTSPATGAGTVTLSNNVLRVNVSYANLVANRSADHFHAPAPRGANAGVVYDLSSITTGTTSGSIVGDVPLVDNKYGGKNIAAQIQDIRNGLWYINIHSTTFSGGEIRSQVNPGIRFYRLVSP